MIKSFALCALLFLLAGVAQCRVFTIRPSVFVTYGGYSDNRHSLEEAGYVTLSAYDRHYITVGYSDQRISHPDWKYHRQMPIGGVLLTHWPWRMKAYYGHISGTYTSHLSAPYDDKADLVNAEVMFTQSYYELGLSYTHFAGRGLSYSDSLGGRVPRQWADQVTGRITCTLNPSFSVAARHNYVRLLDGRKLFSLYMKATYVPKPHWIVSAGGFFGERAYYFDNDLLIVFDQNDTQRGMIFGQVESRVWKGFSITAEYIYTQFESMPVGQYPGQEYSIRYLVAGIKSRFPL